MKEWKEVKLVGNPADRRCLVLLVDLNAGPAARAAAFEASEDRGADPLREQVRYVVK